MLAVVESRREVATSDFETRVGNTFIGVPALPLRLDPQERRCPPQRENRRILLYEEFLLAQPVPS